MSMENDMKRIIGAQETNQNVIGFTFLPSYMEAYEILAAEGLGEEFLRAVVMYGITGKDISESSGVRAIMTSIRPSIDTGRRKYLRKKQKAMEK